MFVGLAAPFCGQLNLIQQAQLYQKETISITYFVRRIPSPFLVMPTFAFIVMSPW